MLSLLILGKFFNVIIDKLIIKKKLFPNFYNFIINKVLNNDYLTLKQRQYFQKIINIKESNFEHIENFEYEKIYNYQTNISQNNLSYINEPKISIIIFCTEYKYLEKTINSIQKLKLF